MFWGDAYKFLAFCFISASRELQYADSGDFKGAKSLKTVVYK